ncbi:tyrosine-type recombinase/integrase [Actinokineospora sp.]|uniref:tyrosine-type recombinase/integrase n=1 Tax=Actinokineospora sp. TaxID=1872133 RepID=UPI003D6B1EAF
MPAALRLSPVGEDHVISFIEAHHTAGMKPWASTIQAARTCCGRIDRAGGWDSMTFDEQSETTRRAPRFVAWLLTTQRMQATATVITQADLRLGIAARRWNPTGHAWFVEVCAPLGVSPDDIALQWSTLAKVTAVTGTAAEAVTGADFELARVQFLDAFERRGTPSAGRNIASIFHRLQLTLFHAGRLDTHRRPMSRPPVSVTGWMVVAPGFANVARRYVAQVDLSLRPATVKHIESDLREFGTWLADAHPDVASCAELERRHIEDYKTWVSAKHGRYTGKPLSRISVKNRLINLHCFFDRITEWGYPNPPQRPLIFSGDLPIVDKPLPRFLDDAAATKLMRASRADADPLSRLIVELLARTGIRKSELLGLTVDAVVQIGSAFWLRIPVGKLHNDRYIPLHPQLKEMLDDWIANHRPAGLRSDRLLLERNRPVTALRVTTALSRLSHEAGIGHVTAHQLRHTLATQAINRGMSLDAIAALLGHKTLAMTMIYARIADRTVAEEYFAVTEKVEALYDQPRQLPSDDEGAEMRKLRGEMHRRMLGNGYCARPVEMDCHFESICESCTFFVTTIEFRPTLRAQRDDAERKGQVGRQKVFDSLLDRLEGEAS